ncbi:MAG: nuclear transport factor 2 family protein, partial [Verrucomicrobia bacterium]|nr:nuclear transport factor 2 family protein [Verrucomicrobiota bacterium]
MDRERADPKGSALFLYMNSLVGGSGVRKNKPMKIRFLLSLGLGLLFCFLGSVRAEALSAATAEECAQQWASYVGHGQADELAKILDDSYQHTHGTGLVENREEFLGALQSGARKYEPIHLEEVKTRLLGDCAVVTGKFALKVSIKGKMMEGMNRFSFVVVQTPQGPKIVSFQAT